MHETNHTTVHKHPAALAVGGFLVGVVLTAAWFLEGQLPKAGGTVNTTATSTAAATSTQPSAAIVSVHDQHAGSTVTIDSVTVPAPGVWVAVEELRNGELGNVLGASRALGPVTGVTVHLLRSTVPGATYAVVLYRDNGDGDFNQTNDSVYVDFASGERVVALFETSL